MSEHYDGPNAQPHRRLNPLTGDWILVSPHRTQRPWLGQLESPAVEPRPAYDPSCYLCPGNVRADGRRNPPYTTTFVFDNDFPALLADTPPDHVERQGLIVARAESGICRVICFSPRHDLSIPEMVTVALRDVVDAWVEQQRELAALPGIQYVQIFENRGVTMGASNPHPHCQVWASASVPNEPAREQESQAAYQAAWGRCLLCSYLAVELAESKRVVCANEHFVAVVPFWAVWPFETLVLSRRHMASLVALAGEERDALADLLRRLGRRYDRLFEVPFPYSMGFHQSPTDGQPHSEWHLHAHFFPPLLRSATVRKFMVGYEMLASPQRDLLPEIAADRLRAVSDD